MLSSLSSQFLNLITLRTHTEVKKSILPIHTNTVEESSLFAAASLSVKDNENAPPVPSQKEEKKEFKVLNENDIYPLYLPKHCYLLPLENSTKTMSCIDPHLKDTNGKFDPKSSWHSWHSSLQHIPIKQLTLTTQITKKTSNILKTKEESSILFVQAKEYPEEGPYRPLGFEARIGVLQPNDVIFWVGYIQFRKVKLTNSNEEGLDIRSLINESQGLYEHVGAALHEYAFRRSIELGLNGNVFLLAMNEAVFFHLKWGFIPGPKTQFILGYRSLDLYDLYNKYTDTPKEQYEKEIKEHKEYSDAKAGAQAVLKRAPNFEEVLEHGMCNIDILREELRDHPNERIESKIGFYMYLPLETIQQKKEEFGIPL